jgi:hypothetical protein
MLTSAQLRTLATQAQVDERTATRWLAGLPVKRGSEARLKAAMAQHVATHHKWDPVTREPLELNAAGEWVAGKR